jgi:hypothetical protein
MLFEIDIYIILLNKGLIEILKMKYLKYAYLIKMRDYLLQE